jgi:predicted phosphoribosyltransferase
MGFALFVEAMTYFRDRTEAAHLLADRLEWAQGKNPLILAIPRGAVPMGRIVADRLQGDLDVVLVHKIGAPYNPEYAIGSVSEFGKIHRSPVWAESGASEADFATAAKNEIERLSQRRKLYSPHLSPTSPQGKIVIIVDDGIATGSTMVAAVRAIRAMNPLKIVVAAPVAAPGAVRTLEKEADELCVLDTPEDFYSISQFYANFDQVTDEEVLGILSQGVRQRRAKIA